MASELEKAARAHKPADIRQAEALEEIADTLADLLKAMRGVERAVNQGTSGIANRMR